MPGSFASSSISFCTVGLNMARAWKEEVPGLAAAPGYKNPGMFGRLSPDVTEPMRFCSSSRAIRMASFVAARIMSCRISTSSGSTAEGSILHFLQGQVSADLDRDHPAARRCFHYLLGQVLLGLGHVGLHLLDLLHHLLVVRVHVSPRRLAGILRLGSERFGLVDGPGAELLLQDLDQLRLAQDSSMLLFFGRFARRKDRPRGPGLRRSAAW